ncbi:hypothetical protein JMJ77_0004200 [Colletotrichum scovillei]|uniref:Uncharacterized protein n=1 Tax=Colletotrichum scovillei TaxID=1209932 RepID=A0A9P7QWZ4_9PEZI|nr:hypothetical protein JMJ77_0004200 [Colletotrichum scovillei]KAG7049449.1 hypothetical protein JMJ78_0013432 [Colletotrichum scovillei]KAG7064191.1 hypothetical protein JMJ76_0007239 [Colletotrichum scovillei]
MTNLVSLLHANDSKSLHSIACLGVLSTRGELLDYREYGVLLRIFPLSKGVKENFHGHSRTQAFLDNITGPRATYSCLTNMSSAIKTTAMSLNVVWPAHS